MNKKASLSVIFVAVFIDLMGFGIVIPILPTFASNQLGVSETGIGVVVGVYSLVQFLFNPVLGRISDRIGRRPIIVITSLITSVSYILFSFSDSFLLLLISRILAGLGGSNIGVAQAYIADITKPEERSKGMGVIGAAFGTGFVFGPLIGGWLAEYGYVYAGLASAVFSFLAFIFAAIFLRESRAFTEPLREMKVHIMDLKLMKDVIQTPTLNLLMLLFFIVIFSIANIYGTFALLSSKIYHFSDRQTGYLYAIMGITGAIVQGGLIRIITNKVGEKRLISLSTLILALGLAAIPFGINFTGIALILVFMGVGAGFIQPILMSLVSKYAPQDQQGAVLGLNQSFLSMARVLGPVWGGFSYEILGYQAPFLTGGIITFITFIVIVFILKMD